MALLALDDELLTKIMLILHARKSAQKLGQTCHRFRDIMHQHGFLRLWAIAHPEEERLHKLKHSFAELDEEKLETAPASQYNFPRLLSRKAPSASKLPSSKGSGSGGSSSSSSSSGGSGGSGGSSGSSGSNATTAQVLSPAGPPSPAAVASSQHSIDKRAAPQIHPSVSSAASARTTFKKRPTRMQEAFTEEKLRRLVEHFAEVDDFELETEAR
jgi:hypothetical protein